MANLTKAQHRRGLAYAKKLAELARDAPDNFAKRRTYAAVDSMMKVYGYSDDEKKEYLRDLLRLGCATYDNLAAESGMPKSAVCSVIKEMERCGEVRLTRLAIATGTGGSSAIHIRLCEAKKSINYP